MTSEGSPRPGPRPARSLRLRSRLAAWALTAWATATLAVAGVRTLRFWPELSSLLERPATCANEADFASFLAQLPPAGRVLLVTDRSPELSAEALFCAQLALAPHPVERRFAVHFDPAFAPELAVLLDVREPALRDRLLGERSVAAERAGRTAQPVLRSRDITLVSSRAGTR